MTAAVEEPAPRARGTSILVARLAEWVDPFYTLRVSEAACRRTPYLFEEPLFECILSNRTRRYHINRIRWFSTQYRMGRRLDPIQLIAGSYGPFIYDGHHRFAGAIIAGAKKIRVTWVLERPTSLLHYLQGKRKTRPK